MAAREQYTLEVPLDASDIEGFKPDQAVKVAAFDRAGGVVESVVKFDAKGQAVATLTFKQAPGTLRVVVGPEQASAEQLQGLQTLAVDVPGRQWLDKPQLKLPPLLIPPYYWWWWRRWCRRFKVTGRVVCPDGYPVPGAKVSALDVDWWWWWWSQDVVGTAVTDANGCFEIDFTWCCGWWPWWWWARRHWLLEPTLVQRISELLHHLPRLERIPIPDPHPELAVFQELLGERGVGARSAAPVARSLQVAGPADINPGALEGLRDRLLAKLPPSAELERLHVWPWWPWRPWWDCTPDLIFKVTQDCRNQEALIVDEHVWQARWDIPTDLSVTLVANDQACCIDHCVDPRECPEGDCVLLTDLCEDNVGHVGGNLGAPAAPAGYLNPGLVDISGDRPYSGTVPIKGAIGDSVDYYEFLVSTAGWGGPWSPLPAAAAAGFVRTYWDPALLHWVAVPFPVTPISGRNVVESVAHYEANHGPKGWDVQTRDLLMGLASQGVLGDGTYYLRLQGWTRPGYAGNLTNGRILPVCQEEKELNGVVVTVDNHLVTAGPNDLNGHPCAGTVHRCTTEPDTEILAVTLLHPDGTTTDVGACGLESIGDADLLQIDFAAHDPDLHLAYYTLELHYDVNLVTNLLDPSLSDWSLGPSPIAPPWAPAAAQVGPYYGSAVPGLSALDQGATSPHWGGGAMRLKVRAKADAKHRGVFPYTCCYLLRLIAHKRTIGASVYGCDHSFWNQYNETEYSFTITV